MNKTTPGTLFAGALPAFAVLASNSPASARKPIVLGLPNCPPLKIMGTTQESNRTNHPQQTLTFAPGYKVIGGGAGDSHLDFYHPSTYLTGAWPSASNAWTVSGKDHILAYKQEFPPEI